MKPAFETDLQGYITEYDLDPPDAPLVVPIYTVPEQTEGEEPTEPAEPVLVGYRVTIRPPDGLFRPRFDFEAWEAYNTPQEPTYDDEGLPVYPLKPAVNLWVEGLTQEEIDAIRNQPALETPEQKIARLEAELAAAREENLTAFTAITELYEMMLAGGGGSA